MFNEKTMFLAGNSCARIPRSRKLTITVSKTGWWGLMFSDAAKLTAPYFLPLSNAGRLGRVARQPHRLLKCRVSARFSIDG